MRNPYEVLGLNSGASLDAVKNAYREKARMYHGDPAAMNELDAAYDSIVNNMGSNQSQSGYGENSYAEYQSNQTSEFGDIRAKLNSGRIDDAEMLLDGIPHQRRNAEWYYLKGTIQHRRGWLESAAESFEKAYQLEPQNPEYEAAYKQLNSRKNGSFRREREETTGNADSGACGDPCKICSGLMCADCCCECMGGDLIRCC